MERPRRSNYGTGADRLEMSFDGERYVHGQYCQFLMMKEKFDTRKDIDTYISLANDVMFTQISAKNGTKQFGERAVADMSKEYQQLNDGPIPGKPVFGPINIEELRIGDSNKSLEAVNLIKNDLER